MATTNDVDDEMFKGAVRDLLGALWVLQLTNDDAY